MTCPDFRPLPPLEPLPSNPLCTHAYAMSEKHLSGYRLIIGFDTLEQVQAAHESLVQMARAAHETSDPRMDRLWEIHKIATQSRVLPEDVDRIARLSGGYAPAPKASEDSERAERARIGGLILDAGGIDLAGLMATASPALNAKFLRDLQEDFKECDRLAALSNEALVLECIRSDDDCGAQIVVEMWNRLYPGWKESPDAKEDGPHG